MTTYFLDTSAILKRYVIESGSSWVRAIASSTTGNSLIIAEIARVEIISAISRRRREGSLSARQVNQIIQVFRTHLTTQYQIIALDRTIYELATFLLLVHPLRAYDAIQLASALFSQLALASTPEASMVFLSADDRLIEIARAEGLLSDNPNLYP